MGLSVKRLESLALRELSLLIQNNTKHKDLNFITITEVRITNDLAFMTIFYSCLREEDKQRASLELNEQKGYIRSELARKLQPRKMPELIFKFDEVLAYGNKINNIIQELNKNSKN